MKKAARLALLLIEAHERIREQERDIRKMRNAQHTLNSDVAHLMRTLGINRNEAEAAIALAGQGPQ